MELAVTVNQALSLTRVSSLIVRGHPLRQDAHSSRIKDEEAVTQRSKEASQIHIAFKW